MLERIRLRLSVMVPSLLGMAGFAAMFAGLWLWHGVGPALTVCGGIVFIAVAWTHLRGGYEG